MKKMSLGRALAGIATLALLLVTVMPSGSIRAEEAAAPAAAAPAAGAADVAKPAESKVPEGVIALVYNSGFIGWCICLLSVVVLGLGIENYMALRRSKMLPENVLADIEAALDEGDYEGALDICQNEECVMTRVIAAGLQKMGNGFERMADAMGEEADSQATLLHQKLGWINLIAGTAPMMGLLGTVQGMVGAFGTIAKNPQSNASDLAAGIYVALMTTLEGLLVAIPATVMFVYFRSRVTKVLMLLSIISGEVLDRFRPAADAE